jgi:hypothetical protein
LTFGVAPALPVRFGGARDAAWEAIKAHPGTYASSVANTIWQQLSNPVYSARAPYTPRVPPPPQRWPPPAPSEGELIPAGQDGVDIPTRPEHPRALDIPDTHTFVFLKPHQKARFGHATA